MHKEYKLSEYDDTNRINCWKSVDKSKNNEPKYYTQHKNCKLVGVNKKQCTHLLTKKKLTVIFHNKKYYFQI